MKDILMFISEAVHNCGADHPGQLIENIKNAPHPDYNKLYEGKTAISWAIYHKNTALAIFLIEQMKGFPRHAKTDEGYN